MNEEELVILIKALRVEIMELLNNSDLTSDRESQRVLLTIDNTFNRLNIDIESILPPMVLQSYLEGLQESNNELYIYNLEEEKMQFVLGGVAVAGSTQAIQATLRNQLHYQAVAEITENLMMDFKSAIRTAQMNSNLVIGEALEDVRTTLQSGVIRGQNRRMITKRVADAFAENGFNAFITKDGRSLPLDFYAQTVTRTNLRIANTRGSSNRMRQRGVNLFKVSGNYPTCHMCKSYRDIVFSMNPDNDEFPYLNPNRIPFHPNCQCTIRPYVIEYKTKKEIREEKKKAKEFEPSEDNRSSAEKKAYARKQSFNRQNNYEKKRYAEIKAIMGNEAPKTLGAFKRMKRANTDNYQALIYDFNETKRLMRERGIGI